MGFGRAKVILLGEHGVVYGYPALAAGLDRGVRAQARPTSSDRLIIQPWKADVRPSATGEPLARAFHALLKGYSASRARVDVVAEVHIPGGAGLGCSAALGVALVEALDEAYGVRRSASARAEASLAWERVFHGNPSGVDSAMAASGGVALYRKGKPLEPVRAKRPVELVVAFSGEASSTKTMVESVADQHRADTPRVEGIFRAIESLVVRGRNAVENGNTTELGTLMTENHALLRDLRLSNATLDAMCDAANAAGAVGAKLTGAGGGGCIVAVVPNRAAAESVVVALKRWSRECFRIEAGA